jgi:ABC-type proline/glycine betaine transport system permease subunit
MCKSCGLNRYTAGVTMCVSRLFCTANYRVLELMFKTPSFAQLFTIPFRVFMNIKISLTVSVKNYLYTVSTPPIIRATILNFNETVII